MHKFFCLLSIGLLASLIGAVSHVRAQTIDDMKRQATNTNSIIISLGDTIVNFHLLPIEQQDTRVQLDKTYWWYGSGRLNRTQGGYSGRLLDGAFIVRSAEGRLLEKGVMSAGKRSGEWIQWYPTGSIHSIYNWKYGELHGAFRELWPNGELQRTGRFKNGMLQGQVTQYDEAGQAVKLRYHKGEMKTAKVRNGKSIKYRTKHGLNKAKQKLKKLKLFQKKKQPATQTDTGS